jgi:feruloyl esterase
VALPTAWNTKAVMFGGGGFDGSIPNVTGNVPQGATDQPTPLGRGYATFASDSGHQANAFDSQDASSFANDEAARNFGGDALKKTRDAAMFLINRRYAAGAPTKAYFAGGSTGGRKRWPRFSAGRQTGRRHCLVSGLERRPPRCCSARRSTGPWRAGRLPEHGPRKASSSRPRWRRATVGRVVDGLVSNQLKCNATFDPATATLNGVACAAPAGADTGDTCLSDAQITALKTLNTGARFNFHLASGETEYPATTSGQRTSAGQLIAVAGNRHLPGLGTVAPADPMPTTVRRTSACSSTSGSSTRSRATRASTRSTLDPENPGPWPTASASSARSSTRAPTSRPSSARGGKLLLAHGLSDVLVSTRRTEVYYQRLQAQMGPTVRRHLRAVLRGAGLRPRASARLQRDLGFADGARELVEKRTAPSAQVTTDTVGVPGRTRPLCDYPKWPQYKGSGDMNLAASFACVNN